MSDLQNDLQAALGSAYTLERELGGGGMSRTFLATERSLNRRVVVKVLAPELLQGLSVERFKREVLLAAALQHPHIVPVLSTGDANGLPWFTMPYVEGDSLRQRLARGPLTLGEITAVLRDVARALEFAHERGVVHRDIKPDNVLLAGSSATVTDFGIAKALTAARTMAPGGTALTVAGTAIGTPAYMAPEQAAGDHTLDHRADLYAFGAMAYELLAGRPPFVADSQARLIAAHFSEAPREVRELRPETPPALADVIMRCLAKEAEDRPSSAAELVRLLDSVSSGSGGATIPEALRGPQMRLGRALAMWGGATLVVGVTAWAATRTIGLPDWAFPGALGVMLAGLPAVLGTWYVQRTSHRLLVNPPTLTPGGSFAAHGTLATMAVKAAPHVSWRRTWMGGAIAGGSFATFLVAFMVLRAFGIGPMGSLMGAGTFGSKETLVVADFRPPAGDSTLGATAAEAIRTDLAQSRNLSVMTRAGMREATRLMGREGLAAVEYDVAREIATREGAKAVLDGSIEKLGPAYVVSARLVATLDGKELATFRATADGDGELIAALGALSREVRGKVGESLRDIRQAQSLERVTTSSLPALRKYVEASDVLSSLGDTERGQQLLREAVALDSTFAMAWRRLASSFAGSGRGRAEAVQAIEKAFALRQRLSENERLITEAGYWTSGPNPDVNRAISAYEALLARDSSNQAALNNVSTLYARTGDRDRAIAALEAAIKVPRPFGGAFTNLLQGYAAQGDIAGMERTAAEFKRRLPSHAQHWYADVLIATAKGALPAADSIAVHAYREARGSGQRDMSSFHAGGVAFLRGRPKEGLRWFAAGNEAAMEGRGSTTPALMSGLDSAYIAALFLEDVPRARTLLARALARVPMQSVPAAERPWEYLSQLAFTLNDPALAREALAGVRRDSAEAGIPKGRTEMFEATIAHTEGRYADAISLARQSQRQFYFSQRFTAYIVGDAFDLAGSPDSAIVYYEKFAAHPLSDFDLDPYYIAGVFKRLGELYDAKGDTAKAEHYYQRFADLWKDAEPELQPKVRRARERIAELRRSKG